MPFQASKLDHLLKTSSSPHSVSSLLFEHSSNSLALSLSDSSHLLFPSFSPSSPSPSPTVVPPSSTAVSFLRLLPSSRVLFFAAGPLAAGVALALRAWILHLNPPRFASVRLTYKKSAPATLPLAHGFGVRLIGTVNYFVVHAPAASQIWVMAARIEEGEGSELMSVDLVKCAVVDCDLPIYSIGMSTGVMVLGEIDGVRVFPMRTLVKGGEFKGKRKGHVAAGKSGDRLFELGKRVVPNGVISPVSRPDGGASARVEGIMEEKADGNQAPGKLRCARLKQISSDLCSCFIKIKFNNTISESNSGVLASVKAISIHVLSQKQFLILDSVGDLHLLTLHGTFTASEVRADSCSKYAQMYCLDVKMKVQVLAVPPDISARPEFIWISDGAYSVYMMSVANIESPEKGGEKDDNKEESTLLSGNTKQKMPRWRSRCFLLLFFKLLKSYLLVRRFSTLSLFLPRQFWFLAKEIYLHIQYLERMKTVALSFQQVFCIDFIENDAALD